ncbi:MAG: methyltransferase domain-containing protein [Bdellovibrionota bacterium]
MSNKETFNFIPKSYVEFFKAALKNPMQISTVFQTSPWLSKRMLSYVDFENASHIIELGSGAGAITERLVAKLNPKTQFTAFELSYTLVEFLKNSFNGPNIEFVTGSAELARDYAAKKGLADAVVSSLPWTVFSEDLQDKILSSVVESLKPGGVFLTYTCLNATLYPNAKSFNRLIKEKFSSCEKSATEWKNIPPAYVNICRK